MSVAHLMVGRLLRRQDPHGSACLSIEHSTNSINPQASGALSARRSALAALSVVAALPVHFRDRWCMKSSELWSDRDGGGSRRPGAARRRPR